MRFSRYVSACLHDRKDEVLEVHTSCTRMEMERFELLTLLNRVNTSFSPCGITGFAFISTHSDVSVLYKTLSRVIFLKESGSHLLSHAVSSIVPSAA